MPELKPIPADLLGELSAAVGELALRHGIGNELVGALLHMAAVLAAQGVRPDDLAIAADEMADTVKVQMAALLEHPLIRQERLRRFGPLGAPQ